MTDHVVFVPSRSMRKVDGELVPFFDESKLERFGRVVFVLGYNTDVPLLKTGRHPNVMEKITATLHDWDCKEGDYVLLSGDFLAMALVSHEALAQAGSVRFLQWDKMKRDYIIVEVDTDTFEQAILELEGDDDGHVD